MTATAVVVAILCLLIGGGIGLAMRFWVERNKAGSADEQIKQLVDTAKGEADALKRSAELEAKELLIKTKSDAEQQTRERLAELQAERQRLLKREEALEQKEDQIREKEANLDRKQNELQKREHAAESIAVRSNELFEKARQKLEELAGVTAEQARERLIEQIKDDAKKTAASEIKRIEEETEREAKERATMIIATAIQRYASDYVSERTVSVVPLPSDELKGRIIGREGRNIRALEAAIGVDLIVDDTPEAVIVSCFHPIRREVAKLAIQRLITDGRIHPSRIEEVVKRCTEEVEASCKEAGEQAVFDLGLHRVHPELIKLLGQLKFRSAYAQNVLQHSVEVGYLAGVIAGELQISVKQARRAGLLHDIGKAVDHEMEGSHATVGAALAKKYGESPKIVQAIAAHHGEEELNSLIAHAVAIANELSAKRPGARRQRLQQYIQRLNDLEKLCRSYTGVEKAYAIQAGKEIRVIVENEKISDEMAIVLSKDIARQIEDEMAYPGQVKVCVIRESRASDVAR